MIQHIATVLTKAITAHKIYFLFWWLGSQTGCFLPFTYLIRSCCSSGFLDCLSLFKTSFQTSPMSPTLSRLPVVKCKAKYISNHTAAMVRACKPALNAPHKYQSSQHISSCKKISPNLPKNFPMLRGFHWPLQAVVGTSDLCGQWWGHSFFCWFVCQTMIWGFLLLGWVFSQWEKSCSSGEAGDEAAALKRRFHFPALHRFPSLPHPICLASVTLPTLQRWWEEKNTLRLWQSQLL